MTSRVESEKKMEKKYEWTMGMKRGEMKPIH